MRINYSQVKLYSILRVTKTMIYSKKTPIIVNCFNKSWFFRGHFDFLISCKLSWVKIGGGSGWTNFICINYFCHSYAITLYYNYMIGVLLWLLGSFLWEKVR